MTCSLCKKDKPHVHGTDICQDCWDTAKASYDKLKGSEYKRHAKSIKKALKKRDPGRRGP